MPFLFPSNWYGKVDELPEGRSGVVYSLDGNREYVRKFLVEVTAAGKLMGPIGVCSHPGLPSAWSFYVANTEYDTQALLVRYEAAPRNEDDWSQWIVTATYSTQTSGNFQAPPGGGGPGSLPGDPNGSYENPEYEYPNIEWDFEEQQKPVLVDLDKKLYQNSALQPFTPPVLFPRAYKVLMITRNELNFDSTVAESYAYAVNDGTFLGYPANFVQCMPPKAVIQWKGRIRYWRVTYKLKFHPRNIFLPKITGYVGPTPVIDDEWHELNWQPALQDQGYMRLQDGVDADGKKLANWGQPVPITRGPNNQPVTQQVLLDGAGQVAVDKNPDGLIVPSYIKRRQFPSKNMTTLINRGFV